MTSSVGSVTEKLNKLFSKSKSVATTEDLMEIDFPL